MNLEKQRVGDLIIRLTNELNLAMADATNIGMVVLLNATERYTPNRANPTPVLEIRPMVPIIYGETHEPS